MRVLRESAARHLFSPQDVGINISQYVDHFIYMDVTNFFSARMRHLLAFLLHDEHVPGRRGCGPDPRRAPDRIRDITGFIYQLNSTGNNLSNGQFVFNGSISNYGMADFLMGTPSAFNQSNPQRQNDRENSIALYVQDSWKVSRRLTVNAGVRWEPFLPQWDRYGRGSHFELVGFPGE